MHEKMLKCEICSHYPCARIISIPLPECPTAGEIGRAMAERAMKSARVEERLVQARLAEIKSRAKGVDGVNRNERASRAITIDLQGRYGLRQEWDLIDKETQGSIERVWAGIIAYYCGEHAPPLDSAEELDVSTAVERERDDG